MSRVVLKVLIVQALLLKIGDCIFCRIATRRVTRREAANMCDLDASIT